MPNDMTGSEGRLCNHIIRAHAASFIAKKRNLQFNYGQYFDLMKHLGINLYTEGVMTYKLEQQISDIDIMNYITMNVPIFRNIYLNRSFFQTKEFSNYLYKYYQNPENYKSIIDANKFNHRYNNNDDVFVHIRLGDVMDKNPGFHYYDKALSQITFNNGYIASDDLNHDICKQLIKKYNLNTIKYNEVETIMFGSTCKNIVVTGGSFSYIIALFGFFSKIYYAKSFNTWFPAELFYIQYWNEISI
jgi:hypothetical protein